MRFGIGFPMAACVAALFGLLSFARAEEFVPGNRQPQWPLKTSRVLLTDEQIARARPLCDENESAKALRAKLLKDSAYWLAKSDQELHDLLPDYRVPRAFDTSVRGCPVHGNTIYRHGTYPWKLDRDRPFTLICPEGGETYPSNDFEAYYRGGMTDKSLLTGPYADSGRGWVAPDGEKFWLVAHACHWNWAKTWLPAVTTLSEAYILTGDPRYARKAIVMLDRIAEVYPGMDHTRQSRYAELMKGKYEGKIVNSIWETGVLANLATAYDRVFPALLGDDAISLPWRSAELIRANIEANLLEEGIDGVIYGKISGNYGLHQNALVYAVLTRQHGPTEALLRRIFKCTGQGLKNEGLDYAWHNLIYKDGMPYESSPNYAAMWPENFVNMAGPLAHAGIDIYKEPKLKRVFDAPLDLLCTGQFTPAIGDSGSINARWIGPNARVYEAAYRRYREPRYAWALHHLEPIREGRIESFEDLFEDSIAAAAKADAEQYRPRPRSRLLDGYGVAILNNPEDATAVSMFYGPRNLHAHWDCLNIELFSLGRRLTPDLGYPDQTDNFHPGIFTWTMNTISHNTLIVDRKTQPNKYAGKVLRFHESPTVHVVDIDAARTYEQTDVYRRTLVLVGTDATNAYLVDVFRVRGGSEHVLSLHGAEAEFSLTGVDLPPPVTEGTLAGRDVALGQIYDDPVLGAPGYTGGYKDYRGSGYSHFFNWQRAKLDQPVCAQWTFAGTEPAGLRVHIPFMSGQEAIVADAFVSPTKKIPTVFKYLLLQRAGTEAGNTFVVVWEPVGDRPQIDRVEFSNDRREPGCDNAITLIVHRGPITDMVSVATDPGTMHAAGPRVRTDAAVAVCSRGSDAWLRAFAAGGTRLAREGAEPLVIPATVSGTVREVDYSTGQVVVQAAESPDGSPRQDQAVRFFNPGHSSIHRATCGWAGDGTLRLDVRDGEVFTGRIRISSCDTHRRLLVTSSYSHDPSNLIGMHLLDDEMKHIGAIAGIERGAIRLDEGCDASFAADKLKKLEGKDVWIADFGPGDTAQVEGLLVVSPAP